MTDRFGHFKHEGHVCSHNDWVTSVTCPQTSDSTIKVVSGSRDKTALTWSLKETGENNNPIEPLKRLEGHTGFVQEVALTNNAEFALTTSWDNSMRLWNLKTGASIKKFLGHTKDVLSVSFSPNNRYIISGGRDRELKLWNVKGECINPLDKLGHSDWVSSVRFSPVPQMPIIISGSWDSSVKVWKLGGTPQAHSTLDHQYTLNGHTGYVSSVTVSPDGSLCASAGKDGKAKLWDLNRGEELYELDCNEPVHQLNFSPNRYWLCAATSSSIRIWDLESKAVVAELIPNAEKIKPECLSIAWSSDGSMLYSGHNDKFIRLWRVQDT